MEFGILTVKHKRIQAVGALFLSINTNRFLFALRADDTYSGTWSTIGGRTEPGETVIASLEREIREEIGFLPLVRKTVPIDLFVSADQRFEFHTFVCVVDREFVPQLNHEHNGYAWTELDGYPKPLHPALYNALRVPELKEKLEQLLQLVKNSSEELSFFS